jgi:hypothetical protein
MDAIWVSGVIRLSRGENDYGVFGYRIQADSLMR